MSALATDPHAAALVAAFRTDDGRAPGTPPEGTRRCDDGTTWRYEGWRWVEEGTGPPAAEVREARAEVGRLRAAIRDSGYAVMEASNGWSIHDVSDRAEAESRETLNVISENADLAQENARLRAALGPFAAAGVSPAAHDEDHAGDWCVRGEPTVGDLRRARAALGLPREEDRCGP